MNIKNDLSYLHIYGKPTSLDFLIVYCDDKGEIIEQDGYYFEKGNVYFTDEEEPIGYVYINRNTKYFDCINAIVDCILNDIRMHYKTDDIDFRRIEVKQA